jgi:hypothetical protein
MTLNYISYPHTPGHRGVDTSILAAQKVEPQSKRVRDLIVQALSGPFRDGGASSHLLSHYLKVDYATVQPRVSELLKMGVIVASKAKAYTPNGNRCKAWILNQTSSQSV